MHSPLSQEPLATSAPPKPASGSDRKRAYTFCGSSSGVVRLEDLREIANLKADLVACYRPVNSQEMFAIERMAISQQLILRAARLDAGLFTSAMNDVLDRSNDPIIPMDVDMVGDGDIEITRAQNRNYCIAEGFRRIAKESNLMTLALRYRIQAERDYRRALEEFQRLERLRSKLPNEPNLLTDPDAAEDVAPLREINRWIRDEPAKATKETKLPEPTPAAAVEPVAPAEPAETVVVTTPEPPSGNFPVAATGRSSRSANRIKGGARSQSPRVQPNTKAQPRSITAFDLPFFRAGNTDSSKTSVRRGKHRQRSMPVRSVETGCLPFSSPKPDLLPPALVHNQPKPPQ